MHAVALLARPSIEQPLSADTPVTRHARPLRSQPHRPPARRQRPHGAVQLAAGARRTAARSSCASRTPTSSARRASRRRRSSTTCGGSGSSGTRARRRRPARPVPAVGAAAPLRVARRASCSTRGHAYYCFCSAEQLEAERQAALAAGQPPQYAGTCRRSRADAGARARRRPASAPVDPVPRARATARSSSTTSCAATSRFHTERHRRPGARALRRHARLQLRRGRRRCADGGHARDPRRGSHLEHAAADAALRGARVHAAGVRAPVAGDRARITRRCRSGTARRRWPSSARRATCRRRW